MIDLERPYHQAIAQESHVLLATRYDAVVQRLLYPELGHTAFTNVIHEAAIQASYCGPGESGELSVVDCSSMPFCLDMTLTTLSNQEKVVRDEAYDSGKPDPTSTELELAVLTRLNRAFDNEHPLGQLQYLLCFGLIGARNKPRVEDVQTVLKYASPDASLSDTVFRRAVKSLISQSLKPGEEEAMSSNIPKFKEQLGFSYRREQIVAKLNRFYRGRLARQILAELLNPFTTRQHTLDEIDVTLNDAEPVYMPEPLLDMPVPTIELPWPILPPGEGPSREATIPRLSQTGPRKKRYLDPLRIRWLGALITQWPYGGGLVPIKLHNKADKEDSESPLTEITEEIQPSEHHDQDGEPPSDQEQAHSGKRKKDKHRNRYRAAVLNGPDGKEFAIIADTDIVYPEHGLFMGFVKHLRNARGRPVHWGVVFRGAKSDAQGFGVRRLNHTGQDLYARVLGRLFDEFEEQFGFKPVLKEVLRPAKVRGSIYGSSRVN